MELQCFHVKSSFIISMFTYFMVHPCTEQGACSMEYISGTFLRVKGDQKAQVLYYAGLWIQFRIMTLSWTFNPRLLRKSIIYFWLKLGWKSFWLIKFELIYDAKKTFLKFKLCTFDHLERFCNCAIPQVMQV